MPQIVPKRKAPGVDFCGMMGNYYIVRSDLGCYMKSSDLNEGKDLEVFSLHNSCQGGDHYLACDENNGSFCIIKGNNYRRVSNMNTDADAAVYSLHPSCQGGDHYLYVFRAFCIIFQDRGVYRSVSNLNTGEHAVEYTLCPECRNGLYYWGIGLFYCFIKPQDEWGIQYCKYRCIGGRQDAVTNAVYMPWITANVLSWFNGTFSFHGSVVPFLPGGLAINEGPAFGRWEAIKTISNDSNSPIRWSKKITRKVGYNKMMMNSVEHNWKISMSASYQSGALVEAIAKYQFSLSAEYGGSAVQTHREDWSEATEVEESIEVTLQPRSQLYVWQYQLGFGNEPVLFCRDMKFTDASTPPATVPLQPMLDCTVGSKSSAFVSQKSY
ncbi:uncharacterized protein LOC132584421 [Heteronotia binoei]|uniref:uncharacterized protein LOC132584421 n=1 Tax=Heteronotia binoei TaxID=13085 RepID=UPI00292FAB37|nr:uncharacterized protein LOC132584421 [Heteronotia binoei]